MLGGDDMGTIGFVSLSAKMSTSILCEGVMLWD